MVRVINNNLWTPVPWGFGCGGHQCNGDNNWMQKMFGYQMLFNMMQNIGRCYATPPQQQGGFYPGLYLGGGGGGAAMPQNYEEYLQQQQDAQSLTELKSAYSEFNIRKIGDRYFAYLKSDKTQRIEADSVDELMDGLNEYVDQNPDKFKTKPAARTEHEGEGNIEHDEVDNDESVTPAGDAPGNTPTQRSRTGLPKIEGYKWTKYINLSRTIRNKIQVGTSIEDALKAVGIENPTQEMINAMKTGNPNGLDADGKVKDLNKLDILVKKQTAANGIPKDGQYVSRVVFSLDPGDGKDYASFTPPDGSDTITVNITTNTNKDAATRRSELMTKLQTAVRNAGWTNVTLWNKADNPTQPTIIQNYDKNKEYTVRMIYDANGDSNKGVATVTLPDGSFIKVNGKTANIALSALKTAISNAGWTKIKIDASKITGINNTVAHTDASNSTYKGLRTVETGYYSQYYKKTSSSNEYLYNNRCVSFGGNNLVYKAWAFNKGNDSDAIFVIDGQEYQINSGGQDYDWEDLQIAALSRTKTFSSLKALKGKHFDGEGPLKNVEIIENEQHVIGIKVGNEFVSLNEIMDGRVQITNQAIRRS